MGVQTSGPSVGPLSGAGPKAEQPEQDASCGNGFTHYATMPDPLLVTLTAK